MSDPKFGTRNYDLEYLEYLKDKNCILKLKSGKQILVRIIA